MIAAENRSDDGMSQKSKSSRSSRTVRPLLKSGIHSKAISPAPPTTFPTRHEALPRRNRKTGSLSIPRTSIMQVAKMEHHKSSVASLLKSFGLVIKPDKLIWRGWQPGEEYTRNFTIKNVNVKTQKIRYKVPSSRFFSTLFPQAILLSAGTSFTLPITFTPLEKEVYEDKIEFTTNDGTFNIPLQALLPEMNIHLPEVIHFGLAAVHDTAELNFEMKNLSNELAADYYWEVTGPFSIIPSSGTLQPRSSCWLRAAFRPTSATVFDASVVCCYGDNLRKIVKIEGIGKYPHLLLSTHSKVTEDNDSEIPILSFGPVNVHNTIEKSIVLHNLSNVKAPFKLARFGTTPWMDQVFSFDVGHGMVPPMSSTKLPIKYSPHRVGKTSIDYFQVTAVGNISKSVFQCTGICTGPKVSASPLIINFGIVFPTYDPICKTLSLNNESDYEAVFQIDLDESSGVFSVNISSGIIPPKQSQTLLITFNPPYFINYYRRAVILIHEQEPLFIDLLGTSHSEDCKPPLLKYEHVEQYRVHASRGLSFYAPDFLHNQLKQGKLIQDDRGCLMLPSDEKQHHDLTQPPMAEYFDDGHSTEITHCPPHVALDKMSVWIGEVEFSYEKPTSCRVPLQFTNHTRGKVTAMWGKDPSRLFEVVPPTCDIAPQKSAEFRIVFRANVPNQLFSRQLECYAFYKCQRDYRLVEEHFVCPTWILTVDVSAHTFNGRNETFFPDVEISNHPIVFSPATPKESEYRTILLTNKDSTCPLLYQYFKNKDYLTVKPRHGMNRSKHQISVVRFTPASVSTCEENMTLRLNDNSKHDQIIKLVGTGEQPEILLSENGELFFRPACVGTSVTREYEIRNVGRLPVSFKWAIRPEDSKCLSVEPLQGILRANEIQKHYWTFKPKKAEKYVFKPVCLTWPCGLDAEAPPEKPPLKDPQRFKLRVIGEGMEGEIKAEKCNVDFGSIICGSSVTKPIVLCNDSQCDLHFRLSVDQVIESQYGEYPDEEEPMGLKLSKWGGVLPARSRTTVTAIAHPHRRVVYTWSMYYELICDADEESDANFRVLLCEMSTEGVFPCLSIIDARASGSGASISKTQLWRWFSVDHFNSCLDADPDMAELMYTVATRHSMSKRLSVYSKSIMDFNFGAASANSDACQVSLMVKNSGSVATDWAFLFPKDLELELDYWAQTGLLDSDELHELHIQDNKLFTIHPKKGVLQPDESRTILFTYKHDVPGTHRLPVLLKIENGKEIMLNFVGVTVEPHRRYLHFPGSKHVFTPVPIGGSTPPKQLYEMYNGGSVAVIYEVDLAPLHSLQAANYDHPVLECINPRGEITPGTSANLEWVFSPLESKTYTVDIPIHIIGGETAIITFKGIGYDSRALGSSMPMLDHPTEFKSVPNKQKVPVPGQMVFLSEERISFGNVPLFSKARHVVFVTNKSESRPVSYTWHATSEIVNEVLRVEPVQGFLQPGQTIMTRITFCAAGQPSFYDLDLICEIVDEIKKSEYVAELAAWDAERDRQAVEFAIMDNEANSPRELSFASEIYAGQAKISAIPSPRRNLENVLNKHRSSLRLTDSQISKSSNKSEIRSFQTLPPIRFEDPVKLPSNRSRLIRQQSRAASHEWIHPQPPKPIISHLGVTARTHDISQFRSNFSKENHKHFIDRTLQVDYPVRAKSASEGPQYTLTTCSDVEKNMVISLMSGIIRSLLDDPTFHESVREIDNDPIPIFRQIARDEELDEAEEQRLKEATQFEIMQGSPEEMEEFHSLTGKDEVLQNSPAPLMTQILKHSDMNVALADAEGEQTSRRGSEFGITSSRAMTPAMKHYADEQVKTSPQFGSVLEDILSSTLGNIMEEALKGEVLLTARPRAIALPPSSPPIGCRTLSRISGSPVSEARRQSAASDKN